jgi:hypothetical protein
MLAAKLSRPTTPATAATAASEALQLARQTATAITAMKFRNSPVVAMASAIPSSLMARRLPASAGVETSPVKPGRCQAFSGTSSAFPRRTGTLRRKLRKPVHWSPGPQGYRELFNDEARLLRARNCDVHQGDWAVVLPGVVAFLAAIPAAADTLTIAHAVRSDPRFDSLTPDDRRLALALLSYSDPLRIYTTVHGHREAIGQHRICAARTAGVTHLPVWYDKRSPHPPAAATLLQRG